MAMAKRKERLGDYAAYATRHMPVELLRRLRIQATRLDITMEQALNKALREGLVWLENEAAAGEGA